MAATVKISWS